MVSLLILSHSEKLAQGVRELAQEMAKGIKIKAVGGTFDGRLGSDYNKVYDALSEMYTNEGVIVLFDIGSSYMNAELVREALANEGKTNIHIAAAALVEGAVIAAIQISIGKSIDAILESLQEVQLNKM